ncbi:MAG TPA: ATP-binding protein [Candidatus Ozemobacteraceae bacterium]
MNDIGTISRAREIFDKLVADGLAGIQEFIDNRKSEELFLDFKRSSDNGRGRKLSDHDRDNFGKALSGFANAEGGVIVWGIDCRASSFGDVASRVVPISDPLKFLSLLQGAVSGLTIPPVPNVSLHAIVDPFTGEGFVVTLIPQSDLAPHQVVRKVQYYMRAGSDFMPVPHAVLAGMFGKRPQPRITYRKLYGKTLVKGEYLECNLSVLLKNMGRGIGRDIFISGSMETPGPNCSAQLMPGESAEWTGKVSFGTHVSLISQSELRIPPGAYSIPLSISLALKPPFKSGFVFRGSFGCDGDSVHELLIAAAPDRIHQAYMQCHASRPSADLAEIAPILFGEE